MKIFEVNLPKEIYLIRHGKAEYSKLFEDHGLVEVHGQLSDVGKSQAEKSARVLQEELQSTKDNIEIISSPKRRCWQTAEIIYNILHTKIPISIRINKSLRDVKVASASRERPTGSYGKWESNLKPSETWLDGWRKSRKFLPCEENPRQLYLRVKKVYQRIITRKTISIIVTHEEVILAIEKVHKLNKIRPDYCEVWKFT